MSTLLDDIGAKQQSFDQATKNEFKALKDNQITILKQLEEIQTKVLKKIEKRNEEKEKTA